MAGTLIEKDGRWLEASAESPTEVVRNIAEEIAKRVERHGRPRYRPA